jgi:DNA repair exonuclease SbcCD nuclease subunit
MNYAVAGLTMLKEAGIPVVTIEGNHDQRHTDSEYSWLRSLANWNLLYLLEPVNESGRIVYTPWDEGRGGYVDLGRARIFGSHWYGASANWAIPLLTSAIKENRRDRAFHILMLHTDVEGHQTHPLPALSLAALSELKSVTEYVGLGHTHMHYEIDNWAFNPGSIEVTNIAEYRETRGVFLVEVDDANKITVRHTDDYRQRPFQRLRHRIKAADKPSDVTTAVILKIEKEGRAAEPDEKAPIIEITLEGQLGFPASLIEAKAIRKEAQRLTGALHIRLKNVAVPVEYAVAADVEDDASREHLERRVVEDLVARDSRYKSQAAEISDVVIGAKRLALGDEEPEKIAEFIGTMVR